MFGSGRDCSQRGCLVKAHIPQELLNYMDMYFSPFIFLQNPIHPDLFSFLYRKIPNVLIEPRIMQVAFGSVIILTSVVMSCTFLFLQQCPYFLTNVRSNYVGAKYSFNLFPELVLARCNCHDTTLFRITATTEK